MKIASRCNYTQCKKKIKKLRCNKKGYIMHKCIGRAMGYKNEVEGRILYEINIHIHHEIFGYFSFHHNFGLFQQFND